MTEHERRTREMVESLPRRWREASPGLRARLCAKAGAACTWAGVDVNHALLPWEQVPRDAQIAIEVTIYFTFCDAAPFFGAVA